MSSSEEQPIYFVNPYNDPVLIKVNGRANYLNCAPVRELFRTLTAEGKRHYVLDFSQCEGMDSTFLGIMAGAVLELCKLNPPGTITLCHLGTRNLELVHNVGLHRLLAVEAECDACNATKFDDTKERVTPHGSAPADPSLILEAHQSLIRADENNRSQFQDIVSFLKKEIGEGRH